MPVHITLPLTQRLYGGDIPAFPDKVETEFALQLTSSPSQLGGKNAVSVCIMHGWLAQPVPKIASRIFPFLCYTVGPNEHTFWHGLCSIDNPPPLPRRVWLGVCPTKISPPCFFPV